jgi:Cytochrome B561
MSRSRSDRPYSALAIALHWLTLLLLIAGFTIVWSLPDKLSTPNDFQLLGLHKSIGITILGLTLLRLLWRASHPAPAIPASTPLWQRRAAGLSHALLYLLLFAIPLAGWAMSSAGGHPVSWLGLTTLPNLLAKNKALSHDLMTVHKTLAITLLVIVGIHVLAALKHHFVDRDNVLRRMLGVGGSPTA